ncbi:MAG TPA: glycosyltransferase family 2 protein [Candidatus Moranbacteria bacterium]|nr:glycosyltransferase family 2 protein [Candidatus Moranbacteria bacterium]
MLPTAGETADIIEPSIQAIADANFPNQQFIILLATEEREPEEKRLKKVNYLKNKFKGVFRDFIVTTHKVKDNEMKAKGSNATFAAKYLAQYLKKNGIDFKRVIFSNFDCDSVAHSQYFAALTYEYITNPKRLQHSYQPLPMYHNNIWDTNAFVRIIVTGSSFWHIFQSTRPEGMVTFSSHSEPFDTLYKVNFWPVNMISEDSIIYWKCSSYYNGDYKVKPIYLPISLDAVLAETYWKTIKNQYKQKRRWAYGIENFPIIMRALWPNKKISFWKKIKVAGEMLEGHHSWATAPIILAILGWLPLIFGGDQFNQSVLAHNLPFITRYLMILAMAGLIVSMSLNFLLLPPRPKKYSRWRNVYMVLQWVLVPITAPFLGSLPSIDSQTRIMLGKYFGEFWITEKIRK